MRLSRRDYVETLCMFITAWSVYAVSQQDILTPILAAIIIVPSFLFRMRKHHIERSYFNMPLRTIVSISIILGGLWRMFTPPPVNAISFIPVLLPAIQTASIIFSLFIWFRTDMKWRKHYLKFLPWMTVTLSINVPFSMTIWLLFWLFCFCGVGIIVAQLYFPSSPEVAKAFKNSKRKGAMVYLYPLFLGLIAFVIFFGLDQGIHWGDDLFMHLITDYIGMRHFSFFDFTLRLSGLGRNRYDIRPVMEIERGKGPALYLVGQVFEQFNNGIWTAPDNVPSAILPQNVNDADQTLALTMFEYVGDIIPVPRGVNSMYSKKMTFEKDLNDIVLNKKKRIPKARIGFNKKLRQVDVDTKLITELTRLSVPLLIELKRRSAAIIQNEQDPFQIALKLEDYFRTNHKYTLDVNFHMNDRGLLYMLDHKAPAYCSYFATAMTLMLRQRGIPARMVGGFLANEIARYDQSKFIVRGRDAHAWVEVLLPLIDPATMKAYKTPEGHYIGQWIPFDPTPPDLRRTILDSGNQMNQLADWLWCMQKRFKASLLDIETKTLVYILFGLVFIAVLEEILKKIISHFIRKRRDRAWLTHLNKGKYINPYLPLYRRFDSFVSNKLQMRRKATETDAEFIQRLTKEEGIKKEIIQDCTVFLSQYHAARFGYKKINNLSVLIETVEKHF
ncbi:MAG: hypothetical protein K8S27_05390 [Candidatus Omnitrophica bacterium]|nr:hypothetical protein [Candidatus Omnitrophota bacterium]